MHTTAILLAAAALTATATPALAPAPRFADPGEKAACRDTIELVRKRAGKPRLDRRAARPGEATAWLAVDRRYDNCRVLVPVRDPGDVRPEPDPAKGPARLIPGR